MGFTLMAQESWMLPSSYTVVGVKRRICSDTPLTLSEPYVYKNWYLPEVDSEIVFAVKKMYMV